MIQSENCTPLLFYFKVLMLYLFNENWRNFVFKLENISHEIWDALYFNAQIWEKVIVIEVYSVFVLAINSIWFDFRK